MGLSANAMAPANTAGSEKRPKLQAMRNARLTSKQDPPLAPPRRENGRQIDPALLSGG
jgi:hypothetical protein